MEVRHLVQFTSSPIAMLLASIVLGSTGQLLLKNGMNTSGKSTAVGMAAIVAAIKTIPNPWVLTGFICYGISSILWLMILKKVPLSTAYPMISLSYVIVVLLSAVILREHVRWQTYMGLLFIVVGVSLIGLGLGRPGGK